MTNKLPMLPQMTDFWQQTLSWQPNEQQQQQFQILYREIIRGNRQLNLTRITQPEDFWEKHLWDSLAPLQLDSFLNRAASLKVIDIGTGAGFPGLPVAITFPDWTVTLLDSTQKKIKFLASLTHQLDLLHLKTIVGRAEAIGQQKSHREKYDLALIRAVAAPSVCAEYALPLLKIGGLAILYRGIWHEDETKGLKPALAQLSGEISSILPLTTPLTHSIRHCIYLRKLTPSSPNFPRTVGIPAQKPL